MIEVRTVADFSQRHCSRKILFVLLVACLQIVSFSGCHNEKANHVTVTLWHQMTVGERVVLADRIVEFEKQNPDVQIISLYKETEELRSGFQAAALAGIGPELIFGPSDPLGTFATMGIVRDMSPWIDQASQADFVDQALTYLPSRENPEQDILVQVGDRVGNHLALVYNRNLISIPPKTTDELVAMAVDATKELPNRKQYGLVWNFIEPFFLVPFLTGHGAWVFEEDGVTPNLDTDECVAGLKFVADLQNKYHVMPANCDYETADSLFKDGSAAMIINGDWSWSQYLANPDIDAAVAPLPVVSSTGIPMGPMVATKGYSLNVSADGPQADAAMKFVKFMTSVESQREFMTRLKTLPSRKVLLDDPVLVQDETLLASSIQMGHGKPSPVVPELRAVWDAMRPPYQELLGGAIDPKQAARKMQVDAIRKIELLNADHQDSPMANVLRIMGCALFAGLVFWQRKNWQQLVSDLKENPFAYVLILPAMLVIAATIVYPFFYNVVLSFSNMSLRNFQDWQIVGLQNYAQVFTEKKFFIVFGKTLAWTGLCVFFHVAIGLLLAVCLNGPVVGKSVYRIILILPWAIPAYITALTWRGMFNYEYGAVNLILIQWFGIQEGINWLGDEWLAFSACIVTNIWLGFPFMMVIALGGMQGIPAELYEAARIDKVSRWKQFWHITLPMLKPVLIPSMTLGAIWTFNNLNVVWLVTNAGEPADKTHILVSYVYKAVFNLYQYGYGAALSMIIFFMLLLFSVVFLYRTNATEKVG
ncbi:MAG: extracellular solute-binding protein [Planctomycetota bacterium]